MYIVDKKIYLKERDDFEVTDSSVFDTLDNAKLACLILNAFNYNNDVIYEVRPVWDKIGDNL